MNTTSSSAQLQGWTTSETKKGIRIGPRENALERSKRSKAMFEALNEYEGSDQIKKILGQ